MIGIKKILVIKKKMKLIIANMISYFVENLPKDEFSNIAKRIENKIDSSINKNS